jgi:hypothetical protein
MSYLLFNKRGVYMRLAMHIKLGAFVLLSCLTLLIGLLSTSGTVSAHTFYTGGPNVAPHVIMKTRNVRPDTNGCAHVVVSGRNFYPSLPSMTNHAYFYANSTFGASIVSESTSLDMHGSFYSVPVTVCNLTHVETVFISAVDGATGLQSDYGSFRVY